MIARVVCPSFAQWQTAHGITPWTVVHYVDDLEQLVDEITAAFRPVIDAFVLMGEAITEAFRPLVDLLDELTPGGTDAPSPTDQ